MIKCSVQTKTAAIIRYIFSLYRFQQIGSRSDKTKMIRQDPFLQHCLHLLIANRYSVAVGTGIGYSSLIIQYNDIRIWSCLDVFCRIRTQKIICRYRITGSESGCFKKSDLGLINKKFEYAETTVVVSWVGRYLCVLDELG